MLRGTGGGAPFRFHAACALQPPEGMGFLDFAWQLLDDAGLQSPEQLSELFTLPPVPMLCRECARQNIPPTAEEPLLQAALLGLCNRGFYSPNRTVVWTESRLSRCVELFSVEEFYED